MSLYSFAATSLTTPDDRRRRPAIDGGQVLRTLAMFVCVAALLAVMSHAQEVHAMVRALTHTGAGATSAAVEQVPATLPATLPGSASALAPPSNSADAR